MRPSYVFLGVPATQGNSKGEAQAWLPPLHQGSRGALFPTKVKGYPYSVHLRQGQTLFLLVVPGWLAPGLWPQVMPASHPGQDPRIS